MTTSLRTLEKVEGWVDPLADDERVEATAIAAFCARVLPPGRGLAIEASGAFPDAELRAFAREGLVKTLVPEDQGGRLDWSRAMRLATRLAAHDLDVTLCLGGTVLASIPVLVAGTAAQRARFFGDVLEGEMGSLALSEWDHGSDLLGGTCRARPVDDAGNDVSDADASAFVLDGEKAPANNATVASNLVVLARTGEAGDAASHSLFFVPRTTPGLSARTKFASLGYRSMDLSGAVFTNARLARDALIGAPGEGFLVTRRSLEISRSGVAMMAVGAHATALALAVAHARERRLYGAPIAALGGVRKLIARIGARLVLATALGRRTARTIAAYGTRGRGVSSAAKLLCPELLERSVHDAGTILGARSLMSDLPFAALRRSAPVLAIFDGSSQLQLDELWRHAAAWRDDSLSEDVRADRRAIWDDRARPFTSDAEDDGLLARLNPPAVLAAAGTASPLVEASRAIAAAARACRGRPQEIRFRASEAAAWIAGFAALAEARDEARGQRRASHAEILEACLDVTIAEGAPAIAARLVELAVALGEASLSASAPALLELSATSITREAAVVDAMLA